MESEAAAIERAVSQVLDQGFRTADIAAGDAAIGTRAMGEKVVQALGTA
jgi:3-isopropylmalate dehydrogenase